MPTMEQIERDVGEITVALAKIGVAATEAEARARTAAERAQALLRAIRADGRTPGAPERSTNAYAWLHGATYEHEGVPYLVLKLDSPPARVALRAYTEQVRASLPATAGVLGDVLYRLDHPEAAQVEPGGAVPTGA